MGTGSVESLGRSIGGIDLSATSSLPRAWPESGRDHVAAGVIEVALNTEMQMRLTQQSETAKMLQYKDVNPFK